MSRSMFALLLVVVLCTPAAAQDRWPQFRGPGARGVSEAAGLPTVWSTIENVAWVADLPGLGWSSPVVWDDTVYVTTVVSTAPVEEPLGGLYRGRETWSPSTAEHRWIVYALDVGTGAVRWEREVHRGAPAGGYHMKNTLATEIVTTGTDRVRSCDLDGDLLWELTGMSSISGWRPSPPPDPSRRLPRDARGCGS